jgi:hypothetical protein
MNAGFSNLDWLKKQLLADTLKNDKRFDARILVIGKGVAASFERYCNREFCYATGILEVFSGDRPHWFARRTPVTQFTKVELRFFQADPWTDISGQPVSVDEEKGYIDFGYTLGRRPMQTRLTYNGGYLWNQLEPDDAAYVVPVAIPPDIANNQAGIDPNKFLLPDDLLFAWITQCRKVWEAIDKIGDKILDVGSNTKNPSEALAGLDLVPEVKFILDCHKRFQLT